MNPRIHNRTLLRRLLPLLAVPLIVCAASVRRAAAQDMQSPDQDTQSQPRDSQSPQQEKYANMANSMPTDPRARFHQLPNLARAAYDAGEYDDAEKYAGELLSDASLYHDDWSYGDAIFSGNTII